MAYKVIKWVKGIPYLYEQESYRVGGTVQTRAKYLGRASDNDVRNNSKKRKAAKELRNVGFETRERLKALNEITQNNVQYTEKMDAEISDNHLVNELPRAKETPSSNETEKLQSPKQSNSKKIKVITTKNREEKPNQIFEPKLKNQVKLDQYGISERALKGEMKKAEKMLSRFGVDVESLPEVKIEYGSSLAYYAKGNRGKYGVSLVRGEKGQRSKLKREFSKALARRSLDALHNQRPEVFAQLSAGMDENYQALQGALCSYAKASKQAPGMALAIALTRYVPPFKMLSPEKIGLVDYGKRKSWEDDFTNLMSEIQKKGWSEFEKERTAEIFKAKAEEQKALNDYLSTPKFFFGLGKKRNRIKRAQARVLANQKTLANIRLMKSILAGKS